MTNSKIDKLYNRLSKNSQFLGGKLIGAGGGGFFFFGDFCMFFEMF